MWVTKLFILPVKNRIFCPKKSKFGPKLAFLVNLGQAMQAYSMPCCGLVGGCGARAVSRKTPMYFIHLVPFIKKTVECCRFFSASVLPQGQQSRRALRDVAAGPTTAIWLHQFTSAPQPTRTTHLKSNGFSTLQKSPSWDLG